MTIDPTVKPYIDSFLIAVFPLLQIYLVMLLKSLIDQHSKQNNVIAQKVDSIQATTQQVIDNQAAVKAALVTSEQAPVPAIPPAKGA